MSDLTDTLSIINDVLPAFITISVISALLGAFASFARYGRR